MLKVLENGHNKTKSNNLRYYNLMQCVLQQMKSNAYKHEPQPRKLKKGLIKKLEPFLINFLNNCSIRVAILKKQPLFAPVFAKLYN